MTCRNIEELLPSYLDNDLPPDDRAAVERHLASCAACRLMLHEFVRLEGSLVSLRGAVPSPQAALVRFDERRRRARRRDLGRVLLAPPVIAGFAVAAAGAALVSRGREITSALEPFGAAAASGAAAFGSFFARLVEALAQVDFVLLSAIYGLCVLAVMLGSVRFALKLGKR